MPNHLPKKFAFSHEYALFLNDILTDIVVTGEKAGLFHTRFDLQNEEQAEELQATPDDEKWQWLKASGFDHVVFDAIYKNVTIALLSDFSHFVFEALNSSKKGKLTVAYALLRKPFKDNLFYFEWLLADPKGFIKSFADGGPDELEDRRSQRSTRLPIITEAMSRTSHACVFDPDFIDELRYDRKVEYGFAADWDQASHLITTFSAIRTPQEGFNFVFGTSQHEGRWEFLYSRLPHLLFYAVEVVEAVVARLVSDSEKMFDDTTLKRIFGYQLWVDGLGSEELARVDEPLELPPCPKCGTLVTLDMRNMRVFYESGNFECQQCGAAIGLSCEDDASENS